MLKLDLSKIAPFVGEELDAIYGELPRAHDYLINKTGRGNDFLGWVNLPFDYDKEEYARLKAAAARIREDSDVLVVIGIGGSYLGARAAIEYLRSPNYNLIKKETPEIYFAGNNLSGTALRELFGIIEGKRVSVNVISKSGTTTEPAIAFRLFKSYMEERYGKEEAARRIYATTDKARGALKGLADAEGYETFVIPDDVGGRYSVLTPVGLLPIAVAGIDTDRLLAGAAEAARDYQKPGRDNTAWQYAAARNVLYRKGYTTEILASYEPAFRFVSEWWKQLYGESEGKENKGIFPASVDLTADLHSMGQYIQQGLRNLMETVVNFETTREDMTVGTDEKNADGLNFLAGKTLSEINLAAIRGTALAHVDGGVPNMRIDLSNMEEEDFGRLIYFFEFACGLSGYLLEVNPFDQPGVEAYKKNMFALLGKPGYEKETEEIKKRL